MGENMKRFFAGTAAIVAAVLFLSCPAHGISAQKAILMDGDTGRILFEKCADEKSLIASTTKIMTALIICEQCNVLDRMQIPKEAVGIEGSSIYLREGEILTLQELLYGMMLHSGNDAATALAIYCGGTGEGFAKQMNDKARMLKMMNTHFVNPDGIHDPEHYTTVKDLVTLAKLCLADNTIMRTAAAVEADIVLHEETVVWKNTNALINPESPYYCPYAIGLKTGQTEVAGSCLLSAFRKDGQILIMGVFGSASHTDRFADTLQLFNQVILK